MKRRSFFRTILAPAIAGVCAKLLPRRTATEMSVMAYSAINRVECSMYGIQIDPRLLEIQREINQMRNKILVDNRKLLRMG